MTRSRASSVQTHALPRSSSSEKGRVIPRAALVYEQELVPALLSEWAPRLAAAAEITTGQSVLDVACGSGVLTREVARRIGPEGSVCGLDANGAMLLVAQDRSPEIEWHLGSAESLPFAAGVFDAVLCQFGLMFFEDRRTALREMLRVGRPSASVVLAVWDRIECCEGYFAFHRALARLFGDSIASTLLPPFCLGDLEELRALVQSAGAANVQIESISGTARFPSLPAWVRIEVQGWTLADVLDDAAVARLTRELELELGHLVQSDGTFCFGTRAHIVRLERA